MVLIEYPPCARQKYCILLEIGSMIFEFFREALFLSFFEYFLTGGPPLPPPPPPFLGILRNKNVNFGDESNLCPLVSLHSFVRMLSFCRKSSRALAMKSYFWRGDLPSVLYADPIRASLTVRIEVCALYPPVKEKVPFSAPNSVKNLVMRRIR